MPDKPPPGTKRRRLYACRRNIETPLGAAVFWGWCGAIYFYGLGALLLSRPWWLAHASAPAGLCALVVSVSEALVLAVYFGLRCAVALAGHEPPRAIPTSGLFYGGLAFGALAGCLAWRQHWWAALGVQFVASTLSEFWVHPEVGESYGAYTGVSDPSPELSIRLHRLMVQLICACAAVAAVFAWLAVGGHLSWPLAVLFGVVGSGVVSLAMGLVHAPIAEPPPDGPAGSPRIPQS